MDATVFVLSSFSVMFYVGSVEVELVTADPAREGGGSGFTRWGIPVRLRGSVVANVGVT